MRLRFGKPSLPVMIFFAMLLGVIYYIWDNWRIASPVTDSQPTEIALASAEITSSPQAIIIPTPTPFIVDNTLTTSPEVRQDLPTGASLFIPSAGIYADVIQAYLDGTSWDVSQLGTRVGHLEGTAWVDEPGNVVFSGHVEMSDGRAGIFANLDELSVEDIIIVQTPIEEYHYIVTSINTVSPNDLTPILPTGSDRLTLITCNSYDFFTDSYLQRMIVVAERLEMQ